MEIVLLIVGILVLAGIVVVAIRQQRFIASQKAALDLAAEEAKKPDAAAQLLLQQINELSRTQQDLNEKVSQKLETTGTRLHESLKHQTTESLKAIRDVTERLTKLDATNRQVAGFAEQLKSLQDILKNPKQRGILGEYYLETTLKNVLPPNSYQLQYGFSNGTIVDAAVFVKDRVIPVDSKFSLENYNRLTQANDKSEIDRLEKLFKSDIKARIDETSKYIMPDQGTMDFAFMFIPHEAIYYDLLVNEIGAVKVNTQDLIDYAFSKRVLIVSPTSFLAFLQTVLQGLRALSIEESAKEIQKRVTELGKHLAAYDNYHEKLGKSLSTTVNHFNASRKEFKKIDKDVTRITGESVNVDVELLDRPSLEE